MSSKGSYDDWRNTARKISMSERAGSKLPFMRETACVHVQEREIIALIDSYKEICPEDNDFNDYLTKTVRPVIMRIGRARWFRDQIADLGFALAIKEGDKPKGEEDAKNILNVDVE